MHVEDMIAHVTGLGQTALAITDTNNLFGAIDFYMQAKSKGLKPILGATLWYLKDGYAQAQAQAAALQTQAAGSANAYRPKFHELVILCKSLEGYQNLCKLVTEAYQKAPPPVKGQPPLPKFLTDRESLARLGKDWIVLSGGLRGEISYHLLMGEEQEARESIEWFKNRFGSDFYFEVQDSGLPEQDQVNELLHTFAERMGVECVATVDAHYLKPEDAEAHEILQCIENGRNLDFDRPKSLVPSEYYLKSEETMRERFANYASAIDNTAKIAEQCNVEFKFKDEKGRPIYHLPNYRPEGVEKTDVFDAVAYFYEQSRAGLEERFRSPEFAKKIADPEWEQKKPAYYQR